MTLRRRFRLWLLILVELSVAATAVATDHFWILVIAGPIVAASWYLAEGHRQFVLPRWLVNVGACVTMALIALNAIGDPDPSRAMELLSAFVLALMVLRQLQYRTSREDAQQMILATVLVIASTMQTDRLLYGFVLLIWVGVAIYTIVLFQLHVGTDAARTAREESAPQHSAVAPPFTMRFGPQDLKNIRMTTGLAFFMVLIVSILVFMFFPRQLLFRSGVPGRGVVQRSEFVQSVDLVVSERINTSRREVFSLQWIDPGGQAMEWIQPIHMRGAVLEEYDVQRRRWIASSVFSSKRRETTVEIPPSGYIELGITPIKQQVQTYSAKIAMRSMASDVLFAPWVPISIASAPGRRFELDRQTLILTESSSSMVGSYSSYELNVRPFPNQETVRSLMGNVDRISEAVSFPLPEVRELALQALDQSGMSPDIKPDETVWERNRRVAQQLELWLEDQCSYTVDLADFIQIPGEDPIVSFISRYRFGHCEYFASALTAMCRSLGIQARLVTGYLAIEYDNATQSYVVRESNAHAWSEVRCGEYEWRVFDPSPQGVLEQIRDDNRSWADNWRWVYDRLDFFWNSTVIAFDQRSQTQLRSRLTDGWEEAIRNAIDRIGVELKSINQFFRFGVAGYVWMVSIVVILIAFIFAAVSIRRRRRRIFKELGVDALDRRIGRELAESISFWVDALKIMARRGIAKTAAETPLDYAKRASEVDPDAGAILQKFAHAMYKVRFGGYELAPEEKESLALHVKALRRGNVT